MFTQSFLYCSILVELPYKKGISGELAAISYISTNFSSCNKNSNNSFSGLGNIYLLLVNQYMYSVEVLLYILGNKIYSLFIGNSVTSIVESVFYSLYSLTSISIPNSVTIIGNSAFHSCYSLTSISIPNSVTSIETYAFVFCYSLTSISIPNSVTSIGTTAFAYCYSILEYKIYATTPPTLADINAFTNINSICKIYVPDASVTAYKTATNWVTYANHIYPLSDIGE